MTRTETQTKILDAAFQSLAEEGYRDTTMKEIAGRAGLATGLAHYYFDSKDDLLLAALEHGCPATQLDLEGVPGLEQARIGFAAEKHWQVWNRDAFKVIFDMVGVGMHDPKVAGRLRTFFDERREMVNQITEAVLADSGNPMGLRAEAISAALWGAFLGIALQRLLDPEFDGDAALDALEVMALVSAAAVGGATTNQATGEG
ncbi:MAG TPA: TetR/AcrR family transcriptional regulator [Candidatus Dormibacteraeota bacterium]